ncbi:protein-export chaperone SecB [Wolbachia endosymbiont of Howardula sp.]|uniref:protein-export chaperone SecB n=1 Tax=Wolbachia endosymbiont of Howardula sp. TaxID=2916816 RepID=UPI00217DE1B2|nr:protein-export chaperone SecB [Wolbachia endosymbiont of Howardula sp.]UWI83087.1 protein-export chaperone SecB [Wolbachia endosymbiont of Howardula sp.]
MFKRKMRIHAQYIKDLSFENLSLFALPSSRAPDVNITVNINSMKLARTTGQKITNADTDSLHEITLHVDIKGTLQEEKIKQDDLVFICEIKYCGIISIENFSELNEQEAKKVLLISGPTLLFPFMREIIARITSSGGFPALMLDPIDFATLYEQHS